MPHKAENIIPPRFQVAPLLAQQFIRDYDSMVSQFPLPLQLELTDHLVAVLELMKQYISGQDASLYTQYRDREDALLKKYGKTLQPYTDKYFYKYFVFDNVLAEKGIYTTEVFNRLPSEQQELTVNESLLFLNICSRTLYNAHSLLYLQMDPEAAQQETGAALSNAPEPDREITKARQLLAIYYLLKAAWGIEHRDTHAISTLARFAHLLTGTAITNLQNSDLYKKYSLMPNYNSGKQLITDLRFIRPYFEELQLTDAVRLIDEEIQRAEKDIPFVDRKKLRN